MEVVAIQSSSDCIAKILSSYHCPDGQPVPWRTACFSAPEVRMINTQGQVRVEKFGTLDLLQAAAVCVTIMS